MMDKEIIWKDSTGRTWRMGINKSWKDGYINITTYKPNAYCGETVELTIEAFKELRLIMCNLNTDE